MERFIFLLKMKDAIESLRTTGFFHVFSANTVNRLLSVVLSFVLVRVLTKADYGAYAYAHNIASFFIIFNGLGASSAVLQICSELHAQKDKARSVFAYGYRAGIITDVAMFACILSIAFFIPLKINDANFLLGLYCIFPFVMFLYEIKITQLRVRIENKAFGRAINIQSVLIVTCSIIGAIAFQAVGLVIGQTCSYLLTYLFICVKHPAPPKPTKRLDKEDKKDYWKIALISAFNNALGSALSLIGTFLVGLLLADDLAVANYQVATLIPTGLLFIPSSLMVYAYPYFARHRDDHDWTKRNFTKLFFGNALINGAAALATCALSRPMITILFGEQYLPITPIFLILVGNYFVQAVFRTPACNLLVTQRKLIANSVIGTLAIVINAVCCTILIPRYGTAGAAVTQVVTASIVSLLYMTVYLRTLSNIGKSKRSDA